MTAFTSPRAAGRSLNVAFAVLGVACMSSVVAHAVSIDMATVHPGISELPVDTAGGYADSYNMTLELKIRRVGNSLGVIIPTEALALLNVREGDVLFLTEAAEGSVRLSAQRPGFAEKAAIADDLIQRYRNAFNELAK
jgi:putative addiction module antidote